MPSKAKTKGSGYERTVATFLTNLYKESFIRAPGSGAYVGGSNSHRKEFLHEGVIRVMKSDIVPGPSFPKMNCECKAYKDFPFHQLFSGNVKILESWIEQALTAADSGDFTLICMKIDRKGQFVVTPYNDQIDQNNALVYTSNQHGDWIFQDACTFWEYNAQTVKILCSGSTNTK